MVDVARGLATLPTRPPTPPKGPSVHRNNRSISEDSSSFIATTSAINSLDPSPTSSAENAQPVGRVQKRVGFSPWTEYHKAPLIFGHKADENHFKRLPPSRERRTSYTRSILKPFARSITSNLSGGGLGHSYENFAAMLESVVQQLAGESRSSRLDAYLVLSGTLKAYEGVPDRKAMADKMGLLMQFIRRDMCAATSDSGVLDTVLVVQTLKLLAVFIWTPELSNYLADDFQSFIIDRSLYVLEEHQMPKAIVTHHMHLLATQNFKSRIMTTERANRLITSLDHIQDRVKGNGVLGQKMIIYQRLLGQVRSVMTSRVSDWIDHVFSGMLSTFKPIRARAIAFGIDAGLVLGTSSTVSRAVTDVLNRSGEAGEKFINVMCDRLSSMTLTKDDGTHVPQIWSVPVLFLRARRHQLEQWEHMKAWLHIIQKCFNASDTMVKFQAYVAWNRLVFAINPDNGTGQAMMKMLRQPLVSQLDRKTSDKHSKQVRQVALASYCNLLYYALKPSATYQQLDVLWTQYVSQVLTPGFLSSTANLNMGCQILASLLGDAQLKPWNENRANELSPVKPEELPRVDPRWVRSKAAAITTIFERIFNAAKWSTTPNQAAPVQEAWHSFMRALEDAGSKEVKVSTSCMEAVAEICNLLLRLWQKLPSILDKAEIADSEAFVHLITTLLDIALEHIGPLPFSEKLLSSSSKHLYQVPVTPSHKSAPSDGSQKTPIVHMLDLLLRPQHQLEITYFYREQVKSLLQKAIRSRTTRGTQLELLRDWTQVFREESSSSASNPIASSYVWTAIAELVGFSLVTLPPMDHSNDSPRSVGHEYRDVVKVLEVGLRFDNLGVSSIWEELCKNLIQVVRREAGDGGVTIAVLEPLANLPNLKERNLSQDLALNYASFCLENIVWPSNGTAMERSRKAVWGVASSSRRLTTFDPLDKTYDLITHFLTTSYMETDTVKPQSIRRYLNAVLLLLQKVPLSLLAIFLKRIQSGLAVWVKDEGRKLHLNRHLFPETRSNIVELWSAFTGAIETLPNKDSSMIRLLEPLILSGFQSKHRGVVNETIRMWNDTFGCVESLEYPECLRYYLQRLRSLVDLRLPGFPESHEEDILESPFDFIDSQETPPDDVPQATPFTDAALEVRSGLKPSSFTHNSLSSPLREDRSPRVSTKRTPSKTTPSARLRHDDSQIQFAAIESSPIGEILLDSQLLTDRQREVKERQQVETARMFADLRSSPRSKSREVVNDLPRISFVSDPASTGALAADRPATPTLPPPQHGPMDDFISSSPTPRSRIREQLGGSDNTEPSSSPPDFPSIVAIGQLAERPSSPASSLARNGVDVRDVGEKQKQPTVEDLDDGDAKLEGRNHEPSYENVAGQVSASAGGIRMTKTATPIIEETTSAMLDVHPHSDIEPFVDAPSSPILSSAVQAADAFEDKMGNSLTSNAHNMQGSGPCMDAAAERVLTVSQPGNPDSVKTSKQSCSSMEDNISRVLNSFGDDDAERLYSNDGQVSSQLKKDLSMAVETDNSSYRVNANPDTIVAMVPDAIKKRKRKTADGTLLMKKARISSDQSNIQVVIEVPRRTTPDVGDSEMLDCIVVDSRPATARAHLSLSGVKLEQTPSPAKSVRGRVANTVQKKPVGRPRKRAAEGDTTISDEMTPPQSKKRRASESPTQHKYRTSASVTNTPDHKKRRSSRLSQTSALSSSQGSNNNSFLQEDPEAGAVSVIKSKTSAATYADDATGGEDPPKETEKDASSDQGDVEHRQGSQLLSISSEPPAAAGKEGQVVNPEGFGIDQGTVDRDESLSELRAEAYPTAAGAEKPQITVGLAADLHLGTGGGDMSIAEETGSLGADTTNPSQNAPGGAAQTRPRQGRSQPGSPNGGGILGGLKRILKDIQRAVLGAQEEREIDDVLFDIRKEVHEAGRRGAS